MNLKKERKMKRDALLIMFFLSLLLFGCTKQKLPTEVQTSLSRATNYISVFYGTYSRLPTHDEYRIWWKTNDLVGVVDYQIDSKKTNEYALFLWLGEKTAIYSSRTKAIREQ
jgi:hypothetical protein